jgi:hypothetical protein
MKKVVVKKSTYIVAILTVVLLGATVLVIHDRSRSVSSPNIPGILTTKQKKAEATDELNAKKAAIENPSPVQDSSHGTTTTPQTTTETPTPNSSFTLSAKQESDGSVTIIAKIQNVGSGTCALTITNGAKTYSDSADVIYQPDYSSCAGFTIAKEKLGAGTWTINLTVTAKGKTYNQSTNLKVS